jgi:hypothetical protein
MNEENSLAGEKIPLIDKIVSEASGHFMAAFFLITLQYHTVQYSGLL